MDEIRTAFARWGLIRSSDQGILGGVCAGVGRRLGLTPWVARLLFVLLLMVLPGSQFLIYPVLWVVMPTEETAARLYPSARPTAGL
ncbi:PspC domain-containing protein [Nocardioides campestrisoli]|uniref:PspC domain-containing protein n=1 Tax=Nocardioides campestrisoli TaxID=2736757 RepID=UPI0015E63625|nr:PspC domain-containing protein [Nocardioides campestrisoli]